MKKCTVKKPAKSSKKIKSVKPIKKQLIPKQIKRKIKTKTQIKKVGIIKTPIVDINSDVLKVVEIDLVDPVVEKKTVRGKKKSSDKMYFTKDTEQSIVLFNNTESKEIRDKIYEEEIKYPFEKLVENIFNTFKFSYFETGPQDVQKETVSHLVANIHKFDVSKGKAFAYFSIVAKHYLIFLNNSNYKRFNQSVEIGEEREEHTVQLQAEDKYYKAAEISEFMRLMIDYWEINIGKIFSKQRDLNIANAVIELFRNSDRIEAFNKKALYLYIREISNCKTQQITKIINKMKVCYVNIAKSYVNTGFINNSSSLYKV
jgi:hypothetical protein